MALLGALADEFSLVLAVACRLTLCGVPLAFIDATVHRLPGVHVIRHASRVTLSGFDNPVKVRHGESRNEFDSPF